MNRALLPQTVTLISFDDGALDADRNYTRTETGRATIPGRLSQISTREQNAPGAGVEDRWRLFLPAGTVITAADEVLISARRYRVQGNPYRPFGATSEHHVECNLLYVGDVEQSPAT